MKTDILVSFTAMLHMDRFRTHLTLHCIVTREEAVWESFSEDEPAPKKAKPTPAPAAKGAKKGAAKPGQGNIMAFFGKK